MIFTFSFDPRRRVGVCPNLNFDRTRRVNGFGRERLRFKPNVSAQVVISQQKHTQIVTNKHLTYISQGNSRVCLHVTMQGEKG